MIKALDEDWGYSLENIHIADVLLDNDIVPVVRCENCGMSRETEDEEYLFCMQFADTVDRKAFCSYAERK